MEPSIVRLFASFLRLGLTAFGGPSMVGYIRKMVVDKKGWLNEDVFRDGVALCQTIPGATAMQAAAYAGFRIRGLAGASASFIGFGLPAFLLMLAFSAFYKHTHNLPAVASVFSGLQAVIVAIVANAALTFGRSSLRSWRHVIVAAIAAALFACDINPIAVIVLAAFAGLLLFTGQPLPLRSHSGLERAAHSVRSLGGVLAAAAIGFILLSIFQPKLFDLAALMSRIDLFAFGGGFASVPIMYHEVVEARGWMQGPAFLNGIVMGQVTPGPVVITATFVGYWLYGVVGSLIATVSVFLPSFILVVGLVPYFDRLRSSPYFSRATAGILSSFVGLLLTVAFRFAGNVHWDLFHFILAAVALGALLLKVDILWVVVTGTVFSALMLK